MDLALSNGLNPSDLEIERGNIVHLMKLIVKDILRVAVQCNRQINEDNVLIVQLLRVLECIIKHGLKTKKLLNSVSIVGFTQPDPWPVICDLLKKSTAIDLIESINQMGIKTGIGRFRAWLKMAIMQKQLGDYFHLITSQPKKLETYYYPAAVLLQETGVEISGLLVGLSVVDCNFVKLKESTLNLDSDMIALNYQIYMTKDFDESVSLLMHDGENESEEIIQNLLDQKNYTEELNCILQDKLSKLQISQQSLERDAASHKIVLAEHMNRNLSLVEEINKLRAENSMLQNQYDHKSRLLQDDIQIERSTYETSRNELNSLNLDLDKKLREEVNIRLESDRSLQMEVQKRADIELAMANLEKQVQEKQQTILSLRKQMEQIKSLNLELNKDLKEKQTIVDHKSMLVDKLEEKALGMTNIIDQMDQRIKKSTSEKMAADKTLTDFKRKLDEIMESCSVKDEDIINLNNKISILQNELSKLNTDKENLLLKVSKDAEQMDFLEKELAFSKKRLHDQAETLEDMAKILETSKLETDGLREMQASFKEARWTDDKEVNECVQCSKAFNVSRRKHHCRRCGGVFCHDCSNNRMCLASSSKPMRVCDTCHNVLLKNYTSMNSKLDAGGD